jgi:ABC-2 type transport system permease protein
MQHIIFLAKLEWLKNRKYQPFIVIMTMYAIILPGIMMIGKSGNSFSNDLMNSGYMFPNIWNNLANVGYWVSFFFLGFLAVQSITNEFNNKTLRQNIIGGLSREDFFLSKLVFILAVSGAVTLYYMLWSLIFGISCTETLYLSRVLDGSGYILNYFLMSVSFMSIGLFLGMMFRKSGLSIVLFFCYFLFMERMFRFLIHGQVFSARSGLFYPANSTSDLISFEVFKKATKAAPVDVSNVVGYLTNTEAIITTTIYILLFIFLTRYLLLKRDL